MMELVYLFFALVLLFWTAIIVGAVAVGIMFWALIASVIARLRNDNPKKDVARLS
jgi:hypothetical protein